jgi:2-iminobutanoate/2-iminopropanoate deaminase
MANVTRIPTQWSYSTAVAAGDYVFLGLHRGSGDDFDAQFDGTLAGLAATLSRFGLSLADIVKVNVWLKHVADLPRMEKRFLDYFSTGGFPARMTATTEFVDADCLLMVDGVAYRGAGVPDGAV